MREKFMVCAYKLLRSITKKKFIIDSTGVIITPGNQGRDCKGNGMSFDKEGKIIECCCDECDYALCCEETNWKEACKSCYDEYCPHSLKKLKKGIDKG